MTPCSSSTFLFARPRVPSCTTLVSCPSSYVPVWLTLLLASLRALLSLLFRSNSMTRRSYGARPATSLTMSRTKAVRLDRWPLVREMRTRGARGVTFYNECQLLYTARRVRGCEGDCHCVQLVLCPGDMICSIMRQARAHLRCSVGRRRWSRLDASIVSDLGGCVVTYVSFVGTADDTGLLRLCLSLCCSHYCDVVVDVGSRFQVVQSLEYLAAHVCGRGLGGMNA